MSCTPTQPCATNDTPGFVAPSPGEPRLRRRIGDFWSFLAEVTGMTENRLFDTHTAELLDRVTAPAAAKRIGQMWDIPGDPRGFVLAKLWAYVAETVAAYTELTAGEGYIGTAADWTDLRRLAGLVGYRPRPRVAARGWVRVELDVGMSPVVRAGTRVQAPGVPGRDAQTFEVIADTDLRSDWDRLVATMPVARAVPTKASLRTLTDPGFRPGDVLLLVQGNKNPGSKVPLGLVTVVGWREEVGLSVIDIDRDLGPLLKSSQTDYSAHRVLGQAGSARRMDRIIRIPLAGEIGLANLLPLPSYGADKVETGPAGTVGLTLDRLLETTSPGQALVVCAWEQRQAVATSLTAHAPVEWSVAPGMTERVSKITFDPQSANWLVPSSANSLSVSVYVVDAGSDAAHYEYSGPPTTAPYTIRIYPAPQAAPSNIALRTSESPPTWEVFGCAASTKPNPAGGLLIDLNRMPHVFPETMAASANLVAIHHGETATATVGSGDASTPGQRMTLPDAPIAYDVADTGDLVPSLVLRVDGVRWEERATLYHAGPTQSFGTELAANGGVTVIFGDKDGRRPPTGRGNVTARYRVGGGTAGELPSGAIDSLIGSIRGVQRVFGAGPTSGGADQDDERRIRMLAPTRARAFGRVVSREDLVDLALAYPGVSHATAWIGAGPSGCDCSSTGVHLAFVRVSSTGVRPPTSDEVDSLTQYLSALRDETVLICVCAATVTTLDLEASLVLSPERQPSAVFGMVRAKMTDEQSPLSAANRTLGQPLDSSDVIAVIHEIPDVLGVTSIRANNSDLTRRPAARHELLVIDPDPVLGLAV